MKVEVTSNNPVTRSRSLLNTLMSVATLAFSLILSSPASASPSLSGIQIGTWLNEAKTGWFCWGAPTGCAYNVYTSSTGPNGNLSLISDYTLSAGTHSFYFFGDWDRGTEQDTLTNLPWLIRLAFNGSPVTGFIDAVPGQQGIAAKTIENESGTLFQSNTVSEAFAGSLLFSDGLFDIELVDFNITVVDQTGWDRVSPFGIGANGRDDAVGLFTLRVTDLNAPPVPEPSTYALMAAGMLLVLWTARRRTQKRSGQASIAR